VGQKIYVGRYFMPHSQQLLKINGYDLFTEFLDDENYLLRQDILL
jgi:hypothetical protein